MSNFKNIKQVENPHKKTEISWWLMELHGEYKSWKVFFAAIEPKKIGIFELDGVYHAYIMKYELAQGTFFCQFGKTQTSIIQSKLQLRDPELGDTLPEKMKWPYVS